MMITAKRTGSTNQLWRFAGDTPTGPRSDPKVMCEPEVPGYPMIRTGLPQSVPRLQARRRARFAGSFVCSEGVFVTTLALVARAWCNGRTRAFQALGAGSSPVARSLARRFRKDQTERPAPTGG